MPDPASDAEPLRVLVLRGGPDRERDVSLASGGRVAAALRDAGHAVTEADVTPTDRKAFDAFAAAHGGDDSAVVFPALHGPWGEGGGLQRLLETAGLPYVGCRPDAAALCMDKAATKATLRVAGLPTPDSERIDTAFAPTLEPPVVVKPNAEGSSVDLRVCRDADALAAAWSELGPRYPELLVERLATGREVTIGLVENAAGVPEPLPPIHVDPAGGVYDFAAKYERDDTAYRFDLNLPPDVARGLNELAVAAYTALGCRHLARLDLFLDLSGPEPVAQVIEVNTMPGFTDHSLLPMAAARAGRDLPTLCDHLVRRALADTASRSTQQEPRTK